jgi:hypothetical protein
MSSSGWQWHDTNVPGAWSDELIGSVLLDGVADPANRATNSEERRTSRSSAQLGERYTPRRLAQFLLQHAVDAADYAAAHREVKKLGLDPDAIPHDRPTNVSDS